jgi:hypothetical protein
MAQLRATFGEALLRAHRVLLQDLRNLRAAARASAARPGDLADRLDTVRASIQEHFRFEEENGYMASVLEIHPHLERAAQHLCEEHGELLRSLDELRGEVRAAADLTDALRDKVFAWVAAVGRHELRENSLVQDAFNLDLAAED